MPHRARELAFFFSLPPHAHESYTGRLLSNRILYVGCHETPTLWPSQLRAEPFVLDGLVEAADAPAEGMHVGTEGGSTW